MASKLITAALTGVALAGLTACSPYYQFGDQDPSYWQRSNVSEATYMEGPKTQQMLQRDISRCVTELRELTRLGALRVATPANTEIDPDVPDVSTAQGQMAQNDAPGHNGYLLAEHTNYDDFETCMQEKGWERVEHLPYDIAKTSRANYIETLKREQYRKTVDAPDEGVPVESTPAASTSTSADEARPSGQSYGNTNN